MDIEASDIAHLSGKDLSFLLESARVVICNGRDLMIDIEQNEQGLTGYHNDEAILDNGITKYAWRAKIAKERQDENVKLCESVYHKPAGQLSSDDISKALPQFSYATQLTGPITSAELLSKATDENAKSAFNRSVEAYDEAKSSILSAGPSNTNDQAPPAPEQPQKKRGWFG
jgi:hypothetical protein